MTTTGRIAAAVLLSPVVSCGHSASGLPGTAELSVTGDIPDPWRTITGSFQCKQ